MSHTEGALGELEALVTHLQSSVESEKSRLARELHDELAGSMVSAVMDLSSVRQRLPPVDHVVDDQLDRIRSTLQSAIDRSRRLVEELRPSILDNFGLFAALRWQLRNASRQGAIECTEAYPESEPPLEPDTSLALFRIAQEAMAMTFKRGAVKSADLNVRVENDNIYMKFTDDGIPVMTDGKEHGAATAMASMRHRISALGGRVDVVRTPDGSTILTACMPLASQSTKAVAEVAGA